MKGQAKIVLILLSIVGVVGAQSANGGRMLAQETQARGYWVDPSTGLIWAGKDNGTDASYYKATKYCRNLRLAGYSDWRLATIDELQGIYDTSAEAAGLAGPGNGKAFTWHVKGRLFLTGLEWSGSRMHDNRGHPSAGGWYFDFNDGQRIADQIGYHVGKRALCVRR